MKSQCQCPKWYEVISAQELSVLLQKYLEHPEYRKGFTIHQPCFMCQNDDRIESYGADEFNAKELFEKLPHPETLNYYFVGGSDINSAATIRVNRTIREVTGDESTSD